MLQRSSYVAQIERALKRSPICYLSGPRQAGKTTLARQFLNPDDPAYFDLEDPDALARLASPKQALKQPVPLIVIDEIQRMPELFPLLRVLADDTATKSRFLILGSASPEIMKGVSESLAGRVELIALTGFQYAEIDTAERDTLWFRGGFPRSFLADSDSDSVSWRKQFMTLVAERDLPGLGVKLPPTTLLRLWTMMAHWHGQTWNAAEPARSLGISETSVHRLTEFFEGLYLIRLLRPWHVNSGKRQVRSPKLYIRDSGLCNTLLGIHDRRTLVSHPKTGSTWEGFVIEELIAHYQPDEAWFWGTHNGAELDLLIVSNGIRTGFEIKLTTAPTITASMRIAMTDLELDRLYVVHGGNHSWQLADRVEAVSLDNLPSLP